MAALISRVLVHTSIASLVLSGCAYPVPVPVQSQPTTVTVTQRPAPQSSPPQSPPPQSAPVPSAPVPSAPVPSAPAQQSAPTQGSGFSTEQLDQMLAPIALYPDPLLAQILMAATYPSDVADAAKWSKANPNMKGDEATKAVQNQPWDPAVQAIVAFPQVVQMMGAKPDWTQNLGDAFLASPKEVLDAAQRLRAKAQQQGNLKSSEQQKVVVEQAPETQQTVIKIEPANPETIYVPSYNPTVVYGAWPYPAYPPYYWPPDPFYYPGYYPYGGAIAFGIGVLAVGAIWGNCNWGGGDININADRYNNINRNRQIDRSQNKFQHNAENRRGTPYRDQRSQQQFGRQSTDAAQRASYRGRDAAAGGRDAQRQQAQSTLQQRGFSQGGNNAFQGARDPGVSRQQIDRGSTSRQSFQQSGGGGGARASSGFSGGGGRGGGGFSGGGGRGGGGRGGGGRR